MNPTDPDAASGPDTASQAADSRSRAGPEVRGAQLVPGSLFDTLPAQMCVLDRDGVILAVNRAWREFGDRNRPSPGYWRNDIGVNYLALCDSATGPWSEEARPVAAGIRRVARGELDEFSLTYPCHSPDEKRWFIVRVTRFHDDSGKLLVTNENVTERMLADAELRKSQLITENIPIGLRLYHLEDISDDRTLRMTYANPATKALTGLAPDDGIGKTLDENFPGLWAKGIPQRLAEVVRSQTAVNFDDITYGDDRVPLASFAVRAFPLPGNVVGVALEDITERKRAEEALQNERRQFISVLNSIDVAIYIADTETHELLYVNRELADMLPDNCIGMKCYQAMYGLDAPCSYCTNDCILKQKPKPHRWEFHNPKLDRHYDIVDRIIRWPDGRDVRFEMAFDITERKRSEAEIQRQLAELQQWHEVMLDREQRVLELKREADALRQRLGEPPRYAVELAADPPTRGKRS